MHLLLVLGLLKLNVPKVDIIRVFLDLEGESSGIYGGVRTGKQRLYIDCVKRAITGGDDASWRLK